MADPIPDTQPPARLQRLVSWQAGRLALLGTRLTASRMPLEARADFAVLACLVERGALSQADIGRFLGMDRNNVHGIVSRLDADGLLRRGVDPADRRRNTLDVTAAGRARLEDLERRAEEVQEELLAPLDPAEARQLQALLVKILTAHPGQRA